MQEQIAVPQSHLIALNELNLEAIALIEPLSIGAHALRRAQLEAKDTLVVMGCGPIGIGIIQLAKNAGFRVIALDIDLKRLQFVEKIVNGILENIKSLQLSPSVLEELVQKHYVENKKIISLEGLSLIHI